MFFVEVAKAAKAVATPFVALVDDVSGVLGRHWSAVKMEHGSAIKKGSLGSKPTSLS